MRQPTSLIPFLANFRCASSLAETSAMARSWELMPKTRSTGVDPVL